MNQETSIQNRIRKAATKLGMRLFRNNVGLYYSKNGTPTLCGLCTGSSDLIGWTPKIITEDDLGKRIAVFTAVEVKVPGEKPSKDQRQFIDAVNSSGGIAIVAVSPDDLQQIRRENDVD